MMTFEIAICAAVKAFSASACSDSAALTFSASSLACCQQRRPLVRRRLAHLLAGGLLLGAQIVGGRDRGPPRGVGFEQRVDEARVFSAGTLRRAHHIRVLAQQLEVDHGRNTTFGRREHAEVGPSGTTP